MSSNAVILVAVLAAVCVSVDGQAVQQNAPPPNAKMALSQIQQAAYKCLSNPQVEALPINSYLCSPPKNSNFNPNANVEEDQLPQGDQLTAFLACINKRAGFNVNDIDDSENKGEDRLEKKFENLYKYCERVNPSIKNPQMAKGSGKGNQETIKQAVNNAGGVEQFVYKLFHGQLGGVRMATQAQAPAMGGPGRK